MIDFSEFVYLDEKSPTGLRWAYEGGRGRSKHYVGDIAGVVQQKQSYRIWLSGRFYKVHRIIFEMFYGTQLQDTDVIDHINGNPFDNSIRNLRVVSRKVNSRNMNRNKNNKTGIGGLVLMKKHRTTGMR